MEEYAKNNRYNDEYEFSEEEYIEYLKSMPRPKPAVTIKTRDILFSHPFVSGIDQIRHLMLVQKSDKPKIVSDFRPIVYGVSNRIENRLNRQYYQSMQINRHYQMYGYIKCAHWRVSSHIMNIVKNKQGILIFTDIKNAYGSVSLELMEKMINCPNLRAYFCNFYKNATVRFNTIKFAWEFGLMQGSPLSPMFFLIYMDYIINDIKMLVDDIIVYMDDIVFYFKETDANMPAIEKIFNNYCLFFNTKKYHRFAGETSDFKYLKFSIIKITMSVSNFIEIIESATEMEPLLDILLNIKNYKNIEKMNYKLDFDFEDLINKIYKIYNKWRPIKKYEFAKSMRSLFTHPRNSLMEKLFK